MTSRAESRAVVLGGGLAGLFATRVLADRYERVTLVDRDHLTGPNLLRRGLPQGHHLHGLLSRGQQIAEELFPGVTDQMVADGAAIGDASGDVRWIINGKRLVQVDSGLICLTASRPFFEAHIRERVLALPNVDLVEQADISRLEVVENGQRIAGIWVFPENSHETLLPADLVLDASGRGSRAAVWLDDLDYGRVEEEKHKIGMGYATRYYRIPDEAFGGDISINTVASAGIPRGCICQKIDGNRAIVTAYGILGDHPPTDPEGYLAFIKTLAAPDIYETLQHAEPLNDPVAYKFPTNLRRHYQRMTAFPAGFLVIGDAVASFNPSYAQGMTVAAMGAMVLRKHVQAGGEIDPLAYFRDLAAEAIDGCWEMAVGADLSYPEVQGERTPEILAAHAFIARVQDAASRDGDVSRAYQRVIGLADHPSVLHEPHLEAKIMAG
ncbi:FAD-dependent oxidoreductase [Nocardia sp. NPDC051787]|uniref:FAD-dependent oxidoreductase n=1 Tax=Nocardia sp. NPDC051787 TaxID=3155415 RepID=UPI0034163747